MSCLASGHASPGQVSVMLQEGSDPLYLAPDAQTLSMRLERAARCTILDMLARYVARDTIEGCVAVGAIPLGIGNRASGLHLVVLIQPPSDDGAALPAAARAIVASGVQVQLEFMHTNAVLRLARQLSGANVEWDAHQAELMSRLKTGWVLSQNPVLEAALHQLRGDRSLEIHCATKYMVVALKFLEDAVAALSDTKDLALHLGRLCVENCFTAFLAARGHAMLGREWLRYLAHYRMVHSADTICEALSLSGMPLLFPERQLGEACEHDYLCRARAFVLETKAAIEKDVAFKLAFRLACQIYVPPPIPQAASGR